MYNPWGGSLQDSFAFTFYTEGLDILGLTVGLFAFSIIFIFLNLRAKKQKLKIPIRLLLFVFIFIFLFSTLTWTITNLYSYYREQSQAEREGLLPLKLLINKKGIFIEREIEPFQIDWLNIEKIVETRSLLIIWPTNDHCGGPQSLNRFDAEISSEFF